jgi:Asp-tRNA(Asn)/Glu-tRNA(Gln) amidotransferase A subunit family amidase
LIVKLESLTAVDALTAMEEREISAVELAQALTAQAENCREVNALVNFDAERFLQAASIADDKRASGEALGPLHGLPLVIKDNIDVEGFETTASTPALSGNFPKQNAPVVNKLLAAGALVMAKANMHELAFSPGITQPEDGGEIIYGSHGAARNPYNFDYSPAGSSTGTAAAIGSRIAPAGLGSDTGGSVRNPSAWCGLSGLRPSIGRYDQAGVVPISWTRDTIGPMARSVADLALLDQVICSGGGEKADLAELRIGIDRDFFCTDADPEVLKVFNAELQRIEEAGTEIVDVQIKELEETIAAAGHGITMYEIVRSLPRYLEQNELDISIKDVFKQVAATGLGPFLLSLLEDNAISEESYKLSIEQYRPALQKVYANCFNDNTIDALIFPATLILPFKLQGRGMHMHKGNKISDFEASGHNVQPASIGGSPGLTVAAGISNSRLPVALGFDGPVGSDRKLMAIGAAYEAIRPLIPAPNISKELD